MSVGIPYSQTALTDLMRTPIQQSCSGPTTELLATEAFRNCASHLLRETSNFESLTNSNVFGIACSAALVSSSPKKGSHRCHVSSVTSSTSQVWSLDLSKGARNREEEDYVCSRLILDSIFETCKVPLLPQDYLLQTDQPEFITNHRTNRLDGLLDRLLGSEIGAILFVKKSTPSPNDSLSPSLTDEFDVFDDLAIPSSSLIYSGSFNPFHGGHAHLTRAALSEMTDENNSPPQRPVVFEIAMVNADKPPLSKEEIISRVRAFSSSGSATMLLHELGVTNFAVAVTSRPLFSTKMELFPGCNFLMGTDTLSRLFDKKYYGGSRENMIIAMGRMLQNCQLIVGGRATAAGEFVTPQSVLEGLDLPALITKNINGIEEAAFRCDISSTKIRAQKKDQEQREARGDSRP
jgi:nicotinic acid mononucleotide adenylyltransferase